MRKRLQGDVSYLSDEALQSGEESSWNRGFVLYQGMLRRAMGRIAIQTKASRTFRAVTLIGSASPESKMCSVIQRYELPQGYRITPGTAQG